MNARGAPVLIFSVLLSSCSPQLSQPPEIAARVNGKPIPVERLQHAIAQAEFSAAARPQPGQLLDAMVDRQLLAQQASRIRLDLNPTVALAIDGARTGILAQAYLEHRLPWSPEDARKEVEAFYAANQALFARRRVFRLFELAVIAPHEQLPEIKAHAARSRGLQEIADWLTPRGLRFNAGGATKPSEELAPDLLQHLSDLKDGQIAVIEVPGGASIIQLLQSESAALSMEEAGPMIERLLRARRQAEVAASEIKDLRAHSTVEYLIDVRSDGPPQKASPPMAGP